MTLLEICIVDNLSFSSLFSVFSDVFLDDSARVINNRLDETAFASTYRRNHLRGKNSS